MPVNSIYINGRNIPCQLYTRPVQFRATSFFNASDIQKAEIVVSYCTVLIESLKQHLEPRLKKGYVIVYEIPREDALIGLLSSKVIYEDNTQKVLDYNIIDNIFNLVNRFPLRPKYENVKELFEKRMCQPYRSYMLHWAEIGAINYILEELLENDVELTEVRVSEDFIKHSRLVMSHPSSTKTKDQDTPKELDEDDIETVYGDPNTIIKTSGIDNDLADDYSEEGGRQKVKMPSKKLSTKDLKKKAAKERKKAAKEKKELRLQKIKESVAKVIQQGLNTTLPKEDLQLNNDIISNIEYEAYTVQDTQSTGQVKDAQQDNSLVTFTQEDTSIDLKNSTEPVEPTVNLDTPQQDTNKNAIEIDINRDTELSAKVASTLDLAKNYLDPTEVRNILVGYKNLLQNARVFNNKYEGVACYIDKKITDMNHIIEISDLSDEELLKAAKLQNKLLKQRRLIKDTIKITKALTALLDVNKAKSFDEIINPVIKAINKEKDFKDNRDYTFRTDIASKETMQWDSTFIFKDGKDEPQNEPEELLEILDIQMPYID